MSKDLFRSAKTYRCVSNSMWPTIRAGDKLELVPCVNRGIVPGDVILFKGWDGTQWIVHRVAGIDGKWVRTCGDRHLADDWRPTDIQDVIGRVVAVRRGRRRIPVSGGMRGRLRGKAYRALRYLDAAVSRRLRPTYRALADSGIVWRLLKPWIRSRIVIVRSPHGPSYLLVVNGVVAGHYLAHRRAWKIRRPFRLLVDEGSLPHSGLEEE